MIRSRPSSSDILDFNQLAAVMSRVSASPVVELHNSERESITANIYARSRCIGNRIAEQQHLIADVEECGDYHYPSDIFHLAIPRIDFEST